MQPHVQGCWVKTVHPGWLASQLTVKCFCLTDRINQIVGTAMFHSDPQSELKFAWLNVSNACTRVYIKNAFKDA